MTVDDAAAALHVTRRHLFRLLKAGELRRFKRVGDRKVYLDAAEVRRLQKLQPR